MRLSVRFDRVYTTHATEIAVAGRGNPSSNWRISATLQALFSCLQSVFGERCEAPFEVAGVQLGRFSTPASFAARAVESVATNSNSVLTGACHHV